jgi:hypothetical protein
VGEKGHGHRHRAAGQRQGPAVGPDDGKPVAGDPQLVGAVVQAQHPEPAGSQHGSVQPGAAAHVHGGAGAGREQLGQRRLRVGHEPAGVGAGPSVVPVRVSA